MRNWAKETDNLFITQLLDEPSRRVLSLERMILESSSFDFRNRQSQLFVIKFCKHIGFPRHLGQLAWNISIDAYRTLAPLKATPHVQALAAIYLASRLLDTEEYTKVDYAKFEAKKEQVIGRLSKVLTC